MKILSAKLVCERIGVSRPTLWKMVKEGEFPQQVGIYGTRKGYIESEVDAWIESRIAKRNKAAA